MSALQSGNGYIMHIHNVSVCIFNAATVKKIHELKMKIGGTQTSIS